MDLKTVCLFLTLLIADISGQYSYHPALGLYYQLHKDPKSWDEAVAFCTSQGDNAHLAIPTTKQEYQAILGILRAEVKEGYGIWVGISDKAKEGDFVTLFNQPINQLPYVKWAVGEPNNGAFVEDCVELGLRGAEELDDNLCVFKKPFICQKKQAPNKSPTNTGRPTSSGQYSSHPEVGLQYQLHKDPKSWDEAVTFCTSQGDNAHLAIPTTKQEYQAILGILRAEVKEGYGIWVGITDKTKEGEFVTLFNQSINQLPYVKWGVGEPNNGAFVEDCVELGLRGAEELDDNLCSFKKPFICQKKLADRQNVAQTGISLGQYSSHPEVGLYYQLHKDPKSWDEAVAFCTSQGDNAHLAIPTTKQEYQAILRILRAEVKQGYGIWVGISDKAKEGDFVTLFNQPINQLPYVKWGVGEPNNGAFVEDCVELGLRGAEELDDNLCSFKKPFICQKKLTANDRSAARCVPTRTAPPRRCPPTCAGCRED